MTPEIAKCKACGATFAKFNPTRRYCYRVACINERNNSSVRKAQAKARARIKRRR